MSAQLLTASDGTAFDFFGNSVSQSGNTAIVGAWFDNENGFESGSAYVFRDLDTANGSINETIKLTASDGAEANYFGGAVSLSGSTGVVGARRAGDLGSESGSAYVFRDLDTTTGSIVESVKLTASDGAYNDYFGESVSLSGGTVIVGANGDDNLTGSAYVFRDLDTAAGSITESVKLIASDGMPSDLFGSSVSLSGYTAIAGAHWDDDNGYESGSAYVFRDLDIATGSITESAKLTASDGVRLDFFGFSVSLSGDIAIVGAFRKGDDGSESGAAYVFRDLDTATGTITESVKLTASDRAAFDWFGASVSLSGNNAIVSANRDDDNGSDSGSAYVFRDLDTATDLITESVKLIASDGTPFDEFGKSLSLDGDRFLVGAWRGDGVAANSGSAYTGTVSSLTTLDFGNHPSIIESISFESRTDWIIGENTSGNQLLLSDNDTAKVLSSGKAVYIGDNAGSNDNRLTIAGTVYAAEVYVGDEDNSNNLLIFEDSASHFIDSIYLAEGNSLCIEGNHASYPLLVSYLGTTDLFVAREGISELITASNFNTLLATTFENATGFTHVTVEANSILLGDVNVDGVVNFSDIPSFIALLLSEVYQEEADCNEDGLIDFSDIPAFIAILLGQ